MRTLARRPVAGIPAHSPWVGAAKGHLDKDGIIFIDEALKTVLGLR
jgi:hypothetical protein